MDHASRVLPAVLAAAVRQAPLTPEKVSFAWRAAGGAAIARVTDVRLDEGGVLAVQAHDPQWAGEVHRLRHELVRQLERWLGPGVVVKIETVGGAARRPRRTRTSASPSSGD
jgi:predicted nucleic acid-binding Zn ribbon protein